MLDRDHTTQAATTDTQAGADLWRTLLAWSPWALPLAPQNLNQPINQGWTFFPVTVNGRNSSAPETEQAIVERHSYGRQIGRMMDAVTALLKEVPAAGKSKEVAEFHAMAREIATLKAQAKRDKLESLKTDLETLKRDNPKAWSELIGGLGLTTNYGGAGGRRSSARSTGSRSPKG